MARRRRKKPNISAAVLEQARQGGATQATTQESSTKSDSAASTQTPRRRRALQTAQLERRKDAGKLDGEYIADLLANPTKVVSEDDLRADYGFVIKDLRNMGILAAVLFVALVIVSLVLL